MHFPSLSPVTLLGWGWGPSVHGGGGEGRDRGPVSLKSTVEFTLETHLNLEDFAGLL